MVRYDRIRSRPFRLSVAAMSRPLVAILCPREFTFSEDEALIETAELGSVADVRTFAAPMHSFYGRTSPAPQRSSALSHAAGS